MEFITAKNAGKSEARLLYHMNKSPVFSATWAGYKRWNVDIDCGAQRFNGTKSSRQIIKALENCYFEQEQIDQIIDLCKRPNGSKKTVIHNSCSHYY